MSLFRRLLALHDWGLGGVLCRYGDLHWNDVGKREASPCPSCQRDYYRDLLQQVIERVGVKALKGGPLESLAKAVEETVGE